MIFCVAEHFAFASYDCWVLTLGLTTSQIALQKTLGNTQGAIDLLKKYLDIFLTDREAWEELAELYLQVRPSFEDSKKMMMPMGWTLSSSYAFRSHSHCNPEIEHQLDKFFIHIVIQTPKSLVRNNNSQIQGGHEVA